MSEQPVPPHRPPGIPLAGRQAPPLSLPRRHPGNPEEPLTGGLVSLAYTDAPPEVQRKIEHRLNSRSPFPGVSAPANNPAESARLSEQDKAQRLREQELDAREEALVELQVRLSEHKREMAELENLLLARERVLMAQRRGPTMPPFAASAIERTALEKLRATLDDQESALAEAKAALKEREIFVEKSEATLLEKVAAQQEHEIMLEQRTEDLHRAEQDLRKRLAKIDPALAAEIEAEQKKKRDEFNE